MDKGLVKAYRIIYLMGIITIILAEYLIYLLCWLLYMVNQDKYLINTFSFILTTFFIVLLVLSFIDLWYSSPQKHKRCLDPQDEEEKSKIINETAKHRRKINYLQSLAINDSNVIVKSNDASLLIYDQMDPKTRKIELEILKASSYLKPTWCFMCEKIKPIQTHHCKRCNICIDRLDHHCFVIEKCIAYNNMGEFIRFLIYTAITSYIVVFNEILFYFSYKQFKDFICNVVDLMVLLNCVSCGFFTLLSVTFIYYIMVNELKGVTGVEGRNVYFVMRKPIKFNILKEMYSCIKTKGFMVTLLPNVVANIFSKTDYGI